MSVRIISGNWKMNGSIKEIDTWFRDFFSKANEFEKNNKKNIPEALICVPSIYISYAQSILSKYETKQFKLSIGAEDCHQENKGAFTGNISPAMIGEFNVKYVIIGHSERRQFEHEDNDLVARKVINAINSGLTPLLCVGESLEVRESKKHLKFIEEQVLQSTENVDITKTIIAYEPVWAIGTGKVPTLDEIEEINFYIKKVLAKKSGLAESEINVLYGGSVKSSNVAEIVSLKSVDGVLVGGASLKGEEYFNIVINSL
jgi:triosephosphate isomerase